ncbi:MAG: hypothetical protein LKJ03_04760 [Enterococcaceae bacterium]|nr:hypothetical protein [Enterococcaceae bacterium]MCI1919875.1 hypothetical protein [Enterococcaceae bacterium]
MGEKIIRAGVLFASLFFLLLPEAAASSAGQTTQVRGEIISGDFSLSPPNDLGFKVQLAGKTITKDIGTIQTIVTDFRGIAEGWKLTVASPNYAQYKDQFALVLNGDEVTAASRPVIVQKDQSQRKECKVQAAVIVSSQAQAGKYTAQLEWNLQPENAIQN